MKHHTPNKFFTFTLIMVVVFAAIAYAEKHHSLTPLLVDLKGWKAEKAEGMSMDMGAMKMTNAIRSYTKGTMEITAMVMIGSRVMAQGEMQQMEAEIADAKLTITEINGFKVHTSYDKKEKTGSVVVFLAQRGTESALFTFYYSGLSDKEALDLAKKFNWENIRRVVNKLF